MDRLKNLSKEERKTLKLILKKQEHIDELFESLPEDVKFEMLNFHENEFSLNHCIRWGYTATDDLLEYSKKQ